MNTTETVTVTTTNIMYPNIFAGLLAGTVVSLALIVMLLFAVILAVAVYRDAKRRVQNPDQLFLLSPGIWGTLVLLTGGYLGTLTYWLIHYSSFRNTSEKMNPVVAFPHITVPKIPGDIDQPVVKND